MPKGPRIGSAVFQSVDRAFPDPIAAHPLKTERERDRDLDLQEFSDCLLLRTYIHLIRHAYFKEKKITKTNRRNLNVIRNYVPYYESKNKTKIVSSKSINVSFCADFIVYCLKRFKSPAPQIRFCWSFLKLIGVPTDVIPPNPVGDTPSEPRPELDDHTARRFLNSAKRDANVIIDRYHQAEAMNSKGRDPRGAAGGKKGDWDQLENRLWLCREVLGLEMRTYNDLIALGHRGILRSMEDRPGAVMIDPKLGAVQQTGLISHLRFYHPNLGDLAPFIGLLMIRSNANLQCVADVQASAKWSEPYARSFNHDEEPERWVWIVLPKLRGAQGHNRKRKDGVQKAKVPKAPAKIRFPSLKRPWSHPFKVLTFVKMMTDPLRAEIKRRIKELSRRSDLSHNERNELDRLQFIKDDMFVYRNEQGLTSLKFQTRETQVTPEPLVDVFKRYGVTAGVKQLRDAGLQLGFRASGHSLLILHLLARHTNSETAATYARRRNFHSRSEALFVDVFEKSIALVKSADYSIANLRRELRSSGLLDWQITNVLDPNTRSRFGNRCGAPTSPPEPFNNGTPPGQLCRGQDCIDGCPLARFLPDALPFLVRQWMAIKQHLERVGIAAMFENSLQHRLNKLERILDKYPPSAVLAEKKNCEMKAAGTHGK